MPYSIKLALFVCLSTAVFAQTGFRTEPYPAHGDRLLTADFNHDGWVDILQYRGSGAPVVNFNDLAGGFSRTMNVGSLPVEDVAISDFNGDHYPDIAGCAVTSPSTQYPSTYALHVLTNNSGSGFTQTASAAIPDRCWDVASADLNHDGKQDVVVLTGAASIVDQASTATFKLRTYFGDGAGHLSAPVVQSLNLPAPAGFYTTTCGATNIAVADFKGIGSYDLVLFSNCPGDYTYTDLYYGSNNGNGTFTLNKIASNVLEPSGTVRVANLNGDLLPDLIYGAEDSGPHGSSNSGVIAGINNGGGSFNLIKTQSGSAYAGSGDVVDGAAAADFNGHRSADIISGRFIEDCCTTPPYSAKGEISNWTGSNTWQTSQTFSIPGRMMSVVATDLNHDNRNDFAAILTDWNTGASQLVVYVNTQTFAVSSCKPGAGVHMCSPVSGHTYSNTMRFQASSPGVNGPVRLMQLYIDGKKVNQYTGNVIDTMLTLASGSHTASVTALEYNGQSSKTGTVSFTVGTACAAPSTAGVNICSPPAGTYLSSPVTFSAAATPSSGTSISSMRLYLNSVSKYTVSGRTLSTSLSLSTGTYNMTVVAYQSNGTTLKKSETFTVK